MFLTYFSLPSVTSTLQSAGDWFNPLFAEFWPWAVIAIGVGLCFALIAWLVGHFKIHH